MNPLPSMSAWLAAHPEPATGPRTESPRAVVAKVRVPLTPEEMRARDALANVNPGFGGTRFVHNISNLTEMTEAQRVTLWLYVWRFRKQIADKELVGLAKVRAGVKDGAK